MPITPGTPLASGDLPAATADAQANAAALRTAIGAMANTNAAVNAAIEENPAASRAAAEAAPSNPTALIDDIFFDSFSRADTVNNAIGTGETGQAWTITGSGAANARIASAGLRTVSPRGTIYCWPTLGYNVVRFGCTFVFEAGGGAGGYVNAMILSKASQSLTNMLHITWNANQVHVEDWRSGSAGDSIVMRVFDSPLLPGFEYTLEVEIIPDLDRVILYAPDGKVLSATHPNVSEYHTPYCAWETIDSDTGSYDTVLTSCWSLGGSKSSSVLSKLAASMGNRGSQYLQKNTTGGVASLVIGGATAATQTAVTTIGTLSSRTDADTTTVLGRGVVASPIADTAGFGHYDRRASSTQIGLLQDSFGQTFIQGLIQAAVQVDAEYICNFTTAGMTLHAGNNLIFEGSTNDAFETTLTVQDPTADRTATIPNVTGYAALVPPYANDTAATSGGLASGDFYWNTTSSKLDQVP